MLRRSRHVTKQKEIEKEISLENERHLVARIVNNEYMASGGRIGEQWMNNSWPPNDSNRISLPPTFTSWLY